MIDTCPRCGAEDVECQEYYRGTSYIMKERNYGYACEVCMEEDLEVVREMNSNYRTYRGY